MDWTAQFVIASLSVSFKCAEEVKWKAVCKINKVRIWRSMKSRLWHLLYILPVNCTEAVLVSRVLLTAV